MFLTDGDDNVSNQFQDGNPGIGLAATEVKADWLNAVQNELANLATAASAPLNKADSTQIKTAVRALIAAIFTSTHTWTLAQTFSVTPTIPAPAATLVPLPTGFSLSSGRLRPSVVKTLDGTVTFVGNMARTSGTDSTTAPTWLAAIPAGYRPLGTMFAPITVQDHLGNFLDGYSLAVDSSGNLIVESISGASAWVSAQWTVAWNVNQPVAP